MSEDGSSRCYHCGEELEPGKILSGEFGGKTRHFCCNGCLGACQIIYTAGEQAYYERRTAPAPRFFDSLPDEYLTQEGLETVAPETRDTYLASFDLPAVMDEYVEKVSPERMRIVMTIQGIHCSSCVFLNERILSGTRGIYEANVNYDTGRAFIEFNPEQIRISGIITTIQSIGYNAVPLRPGQKSEVMKQEGKDLLWKLTVAGFLAGNIMMIAMGDWFGFFSDSISPHIRKFFHWAEFFLATPAFFYTGATFHRGWKSFLKTGLAGMDLLISSGISVAFFYSIYVTLGGTGEVYFDSVATIIFFLLVGRYFEWVAKYNQRLRMEDLIKPLPAHTTRIRESGNELISIKELERGDRILVIPGETLPADGVLENDAGELDESVLTGESIPVLRKQGDRLLAGSRVVSGRLKVRIDSLPEESSLSVLGRLADMAGMHKTGIERITLQIIPWFSNGILLIAIMTFIIQFWLLGSGIHGAITATISVLIISCPCALALAVPTAIGSALYLGLSKGILVREGGVLENLASIRHFFFDKTGTLTTGRPQVVKAESFSPDGFSLAHHMETGSLHPVGRAIQEYSRKKGVPGEFSGVPDEVPGQGVTLEIGSTLYRLGKPDFLDLDPGERGVLEDFINTVDSATVVGLEGGGKLMALFGLKDRPEESARKSVEALLHESNRVEILTGDARGPALGIAAEMGIPPEQVRSDLLPDQKEKIVDEIESQGKHTCMVGDGYNDAVALSRASVSIVMARGAPLSLEHAGIILLQNDLQGLHTARKLARRTMGTIYTNLGLSLLYNGIMIPVAASGLLLPVWCSLFMSLSSLTVVGISTALRLRGLDD